MNIERVRQICLEQAQTEELDHFGKPSYRVKGKIFATLWVEEKKLVLKLNGEDQADCCSRYPSACSPVKGFYGKQGWTEVYLDQNLNEETGSGLIRKAWFNVAPAKLRNA